MFLQLARIEAITRNRACRFGIDGTARRILVYDLNDPSDATDDLPIADATLSSHVSFGSPTGGAAITLTHVSGDTYQATFSPDGSVSSGSGSISMRGRDHFERIALYGAGGTRVERWNGSAWEPRP
jgi:Tfp pilus assembly protein FimT